MLRGRQPLLMPMLLAAPLALAGCGGKPVPVPPDKCAYVGEWSGVGMHMRLKADGEFDYLRAHQGTQAAVRAPLVGFDGDDLRVGQWILVSRFRVGAPPHQDADGNWKMTFEGVELTRSGPSGCDAPSAPAADDRAAPLQQI